MKTKIAFLFIALISLVTHSAYADVFTELQGKIRGYRNLSSTPQPPAVNFFDQEGKAVSLEEYKGKVVVLNFWATWCAPCVKEMPALDKVAEHFKGRGLEVITVATGRQGRETPEDFLKKRNLVNVTNVYDKDQAFLREMNINSLPVTLLVSPDGLLRGGLIGMTQWDSDETLSALETTLQ